MAASLVLVAAVAALISWLRPERGVLAIVQTYGILLAAAVLCAGQHRRSDDGLVH